MNERIALELVFKLRNSDLDMRPIPPLNFNFTDSNSGKKFTFNEIFKELYVGEKFKNSLKYIQDVANQRNKLLYASSAGKPSIQDDIEEYLIEQKSKVFTFIYITLLIDPWEKSEGNSAFVQQVLNSYLLLLEKVKLKDI